MVVTTALIAIGVKSFTDKTVLFKLPKSAYVDDIKCIIEVEEDIPQHQRRLLYCGRQLEDGE